MPSEPNFSPRLGSFSAHVKYGILSRFEQLRCWLFQPAQTSELNGSCLTHKVKPAVNTKRDEIAEKSYTYELMKGGGLKFARARQKFAFTEGNGKGWQIRL